jgi:hypothetical protein
MTVDQFLFYERHKWLNVVTVAQWPHQFVMCADHIACINLAVLAGGIYFFLNGRIEQAGLS